MIKLIGTAYRRDDFTPDDFMRYWLEVHAPISARRPGLRGYVVSEVIRRVRGEMQTDAFVEQWFDDEASYAHARQSPQAAEAWADLEKYAKPEGTFWVLNENVLIPPPLLSEGLLE
jgi:uncharacterized protein (TIGR02118 family)